MGIRAPLLRSWCNSANPAAKQPTQPAPHRPTAVAQATGTRLAAVATCSRPLIALPNSSMTLQILYEEKWRIAGWAVNVLVTTSDVHDTGAHGTQSGYSCDEVAHSQSLHIIWNL